MDVFQESHPLLIDEILHIVFGYCKYKQLEVCREVCLKWSKAADSHCYEKAPVRKFEGRGIRKGLEVPPKMCVNGQLEDTKRYNKFYLDQFSFGSNWRVDNQFFNTHGKLITYLELGYCTILSGKAFWGLLFCEKTPCLQTLKLDWVAFSFLKNKVLPDKPIKNPVLSMRTLEIRYHDRFSNLPVSWNQVLETFPRLKSLGMENYATDTECELGRLLHKCAGYYNKQFGKCELGRLFQGVKKFHNNNNDIGHPLNILKLAHKRNDNYKDYFPDGMLELFQEEIKKNISYGLALKSLAFTADNILDERKCYQLVSHQSKELQKLKIAVKFPTFEGGVVFLEKFDLPPGLEKLTSLDLWDCRIVNFRYLLACPNLKHLTVMLNILKARETEENALNTVKANTTDWGPSEKSEFSLQSLVSFHCNFLIKWDADDIRLIRKWFPNLTSLMIHSDNNTFEVICSEYQKLKRLCVYDSKVTDSAFTGLSGNQSDGDEDGTTGNGRRPSIVDLKELEELALHRFEKGHVHFDFEAAKLTESSVNDGFLKIQNLKKLCISYFGITKSALDELDKAGFQGHIERFVDPRVFVSDGAWYTYKSEYVFQCDP